MLKLHVPAVIGPGENIMVDLESNCNESITSEGNREVAWRDWQGSPADLHQQQMQPSVQRRRHLLIRLTS